MCFLLNLWNNFYRSMKVVMSKINGKTVSKSSLQVWKSSNFEEEWEEDEQMFTAMLMEEE